MKHSFSVSELQTVCSVHVANDPSQVVSVNYVRDSGVVSIEVLDSQLPKHWTFCQQLGDSVILRLTEWAEGLYRAVKFAKMIIEWPLEGLSYSGTPSKVWSRVLVCWSTAISETSFTKNAGWSPPPPTLLPYEDSM